MLDEGVQGVQDLKGVQALELADRLDELQAGAALEATQAVEQLLRRLGQQPDTPVDRGLQGPLPLIDVPGGVAQQGGADLDPVQQPARLEGPAARRRELQGQRQTASCGVPCCGASLSLPLACGRLKMRAPGPVGEDPPVKASPVPRNSRGPLAGRDRASCL